MARHGSIDPPPDGEASGSDRLRLALTRGRLLSLAGAIAFERGEDYASQGRVRSISLTTNGVTALVQGGQRYRVVIELTDGDVGASCDCPVGEDGRFCKHQVALALAWLDEVGPTRAGRSRPVTMTETRNYLLGLDAPTLASMLLAEADRDDALRGRLLVRTATAAAEAGDLDVQAVRRAIDQAARVRGHVPYAEAWDFVQGIDEAIDLIEEVREAGDAAAAIDLAEYGLRRVEGAIESIDDSDGGMGEMLARLQVIHLDACQAARPDPVQLATRLFEWELHDEWGVFSGAVERYRDVLGESGLDAYRGLAEAAWSSVPTIGPGGRGIGGDPHLRIRWIRLAVARVSGDVDELIAVQARDLSLPSAYLDIARVCAEAGRDDDAMAWVEQGIAAFPERPDERLRDFLIAAYQRRGRHDDAVAQAWAAFSEAPNLTRYQVLRSVVTLADGSLASSWPVWSARAVDHVRQSVVSARAARPTRSRFAWLWERDGSVAVQIHLSEDDLDAAWAAAQDLGCSRHLWLELARGREAAHPADSIAIYQRDIEMCIDTKSNDGYAAAVRLVARVAAIMSRLGQDLEFRTYRLELRARHGRKRNFVKLLDRSTTSS